ncbi:MAG TPA: hypothetical protein VKF42_08470 [Chitinivibrionales bacterium]|nr:hypothetical protein [Chitinivibrionales bacterium]
MHKASMFLVLVVAAGVGITAAEVNPPLAPAQSRDSMQGPGSKMCPAMAGKGCCMQQGQWPGRRWDGPMAGPGFNPMFQNGPGWRFNGPAGMHPHFMVKAHKLFHAALLAMVLVNILLTILVGLDMAKRSRFNGLWIAIVLVAGLPGSAVYALFRIGDGIAEVKKT